MYFRPNHAAHPELVLIKYLQSEINFHSNWGRGDRPEIPGRYTSNSGLKSMFLGTWQISTEDTFYEREQGEALSRDQIYSTLNAFSVEADLDYSFFKSISWIK